MTEEFATYDPQTDGQQDRANGHGSNGQHGGSKGVDHFAAVPDDLKTQPNRWVVWKRIQRQEKPKPDKVPFIPGIGGRQPASHSDPTTWRDFAIAEADVIRVDSPVSGVGFMLNGDGIVGLDFDGCFINKGARRELLPWAAKAVALLDSYTEISPSGDGLRIFVRMRPGEFPTSKIKFKQAEFYRTERFLTVTGRHWPGTPRVVNERTEAVQEIHGWFVGDDDTIYTLKHGPSHNDFVALMAGGNLHHGNSEADMALVRLIANACAADGDEATGGDLQTFMERVDRIFRLASGTPGKPDSGRENLNNGKWDEIHHSNGDTYGEGTVRKVCEEIQARRAETRRQIGQDPSNEQQAVLLTAPLTDLGDAEAVAAVYGDDYRFEGKSQRWYHRASGTVVWREDDMSRFHQAVAKVVRLRGTVAALLPSAEARNALAGHARCQEANGKLKAIAERCSKIAPFATDIRQFDTDIWALAVENGVIDLRSGTLRRVAELRPDELYLHCAGTSYQPEATCPRWEQFISEIFPDREVRRYVQKLLGYSLTGDVEQQLLVMLIGDGANGKSTLIEVVMKLLGSYAVVADFNMVDANGRHGMEDTACLRGARFVAIVEAEEERRLNEGKVKKLTGGDTLRGEFKYGHVFQFEPTHKLWFAVNRRPRIVGTDYGIWRRIKAIPFMRQFERGVDADTHLKEKLLQEKAGILNWLLEGLRLFIAEGANDPAEVTEYVAGYKKDSDNVRLWVEEHTVEKTIGTMDSDLGYYSYKTWCERRGDFRLSKQQWSGRLHELGYPSERQRRNGTGGWQTVYRGLILDDNNSVF